MAKVLVTDYWYDNLDVERVIVQPAGGVIDARQCKAAEQLVPLVGDADVVLSQFSLVDARVIAAMKRVRVIVRYGIGVDNIDIAAARQRAIPVCNVPDYCINEVADHTLAFILAVTRQVVTHTVHLRAGQWGQATPDAGLRTLKDLVVGVVGFGRIGRAVVHRLRAFGGPVRVFDPIASKSDIEAAGATAAGSLAELLPTCNVLTLHCPATPQNRYMIDERTLAMMKPGSILINLARGTLVVTDALVKARPERAVGGRRPGRLRSGADSDRPSATDHAERGSGSAHCLDQCDGGETPARNRGQHRGGGLARREIVQYRQRRRRTLSKYQKIIF